MEQDKILERLKDMLTEHAPELRILPANQIVAPADTCWLDGNKCWYGLPDGKFENRPTHICHLGANGCSRLKDKGDTLLDLISDNHIKNRIEEVIQKEIITVSSELRVIATDLMDDPQELERQTLKLAADILEGNEEYDTRIVRVDDI